jgi:hypothetical protein
MQQGKAFRDPYIDFFFHIFPGIKSDAVMAELLDVA